MKLAIMTQSTFFVEEDKILAALFEAGLDNLHLYKPGSSPIYSERLLSLLPSTTYNKITVHEHFYLKDEYNLAGIHLEDVSIEEPMGYKGRISRTCKRIEDLKETKKNSSYVFLGNILNSQSSKTLRMIRQTRRQRTLLQPSFLTDNPNFDRFSLQGISC